MKSREKILIAPIGDVDEEMIRDLSSNLRDIMGCDVEILDSIENPKHAYDPTRKQFHSTDVLSALRREVFEKGGSKQTSGRVLGVTDVDLYIVGLDFVFGEADLLGRTAIISLKRLRPEFYSLKPDRELLLRRATREAVHDLGHIFGLGHCIQESCVMHPSSSVEETDRKGSGFCERCQQHIGGAVAQRERI